MVTSDMSTNSNSSTFFATLGARVAAGLNGPALLRGVVPAIQGGMDWLVALGFPDAAAASRSRSVLARAVGIDIGSSARVSDGGSVPL